MRIAGSPYSYDYNYFLYKQYNHYDYNVEL